MILLEKFLNKGWIIKAEAMPGGYLVTAAHGTKYISTSRMSMDKAIASIVAELDKAEPALRLQ